MLKSPMINATFGPLANFQNTFAQKYACYKSLMESISDFFNNLGFAPGETKNLREVTLNLFAFLKNLDECNTESYTNFCKILELYTSLDFEKNLYEIDKLQSQLNQENTNVKPFTNNDLVNFLQNVQIEEPSINIEINNKQKITKEINLDQAMEDIDLSSLIIKKLGVVYKPLIPRYKATINQLSQFKLEAFSSFLKGVN